MCFCRFNLSSLCVCFSAETCSICGISPVHAQCSTCVQRLCMKCDKLFHSHPDRKGHKRTIITPAKTSRWGGGKKRSYKPNQVQVHFFIRLQCGQTIRAVVRERELLTSLNLSCSRSVEVVGEKFCKWTKMLKHLISSYFKYVNLSEKLIFNAQPVSHHMLSCFRFYYRLVCVSFFALLPVLSSNLTLVSLSNLLNNCHFLLFSWVQEISRYKFRLKT